MIKLLQNHYQWIFSGIGVMIISLIISSIFYLSKSKKNKINLTKSRNKDFIPPIKRTRIRFARIDDYEEIIEIGTHYLGRENCITKKQYEDWYNTNNKMIRVIECNSSLNQDKWKICGYYIVVPISSTTYNFIKSGKLMDFDMECDSILNYNDPSLKYLLITDLITSKDICKDSTCSHIFGTRLIKDLAYFIHSNLNQNIEEIGTITATKEGKALVERLGFKEFIGHRDDIGWKFWTIMKDDLNEKYNEGFLGINNYNFQETSVD